MDPDTLRSCGDELYEALRGQFTVAPLTDRYPELSLEDAYAVSRQLLARRLADGETVVGKKIGVTSRAVQLMLNVHQPDFGFLTDAMVFNSGDDLPISDLLIQPRAEGEIAFMLKRDLSGPGVTCADVAAATEGVMPCFEIVDSRIEDWKISIQDTVADNASCGLFVLGNALVPLDRVDLATCGMVLEKNGEIVATGAGAAALGSPLNAVAWLANTLGGFGIGLSAGEVILSGSLAALVSVKPGDSMSMRIGGIGGASVRFA
jgi:2-oxopent-4-enoate/cis-2-oxohex-4-enoate hydratase